MSGDKKYFSGPDLNNDGVHDYKDDALYHSFFSDRDTDEEKSSFGSYSRYSVLDDDDDEYDDDYDDEDDDDWDDDDDEDWDDDDDY